MKIKVIDKEVVQDISETHFKIIINGKEVCISKWHEFTSTPNVCEDGGIDIIEGRELLTDKEAEELEDYISEYEEVA